MAFAVALDLRDLDDRLPPGTQARVIGRHLAAVRPFHFEHHPVGQVRIVRNGQRLSARLAFVGGHVIPQLRGLRIETGKRYSLLRPVAAVAEHHHPVEIVAIRHQRPLEAGKGGEDTRLVERIDRIEMFLPDFLRRLCGPLRIAQSVRQSPVSRRCNQFRHGPDRGIPAFAQHGLPSPQCRIAHQWTRGIHQTLGRTQPVRVIGNDEKIERAIELGGHSRRRRHFFAPRKAQSRFRTETHAEAEGIDRIVGVEVRVAPIHPVRILRQLDRACAVPLLRLAGIAHGPVAAGQGERAAQRQRGSYHVRSACHGSLPKDRPVHTGPA